MKKQEKLIFLTTFVFSIIIFIFALVVMLLQNLGVINHGGTITVMVALSMGFGLYYNYTGIRKLLEINKRDIEEIMAYEAMQAEKAAEAADTEEDADCEEEYEDEDDE